MTKTVEIISPESIHQNAIDHGWYEEPHEIGTSLALIHSEVSEALEALHNHDQAKFAEELADVIIRTFDLAAHQGIDIIAQVAKKHQFNQTRDHRHGGKAF